MNSFASSGIYPVNRAVISDEQLKTGLIFNPDDEETEKETVQSEAGPSEPTENESISVKVFNTYVSVLTTPAKEKYHKRQEEGKDVQGVSPGYDTYVLLKSKVNAEIVSVKKLKDKETPIDAQRQAVVRAEQSPSACGQDTEVAPQKQIETPEQPMAGLDLLAFAAFSATSTNTSDSAKGRADTDKSKAKGVSPVIMETLVLPETKQSQKRKRSSLLDDLPDNLTNPETIRKLALKDLEKTRKFAAKEKRAKAAYLSRTLKQKKKCKQSVKHKEPVSQVNVSEDEAMCIVCEITRKEDKSLMLGHIWI